MRAGQAWKSGEILTEKLEVACKFKFASIRKRSAAYFFFFLVVAALGLKFTFPV
jgi:hypothetical protein